MNDRKKYYKLDDIGFIGTQEKKTDAEKKKLYDKTSEYIKAEKAAKGIKKVA